MTVGQVLALRADHAGTFTERLARVEREMFGSFPFIRVGAGPTGKRAGLCRVNYVWDGRQLVADKLLDLPVPSLLELEVGLALFLEELTDIVIALRARDAGTTAAKT